MAMAISGFFQTTGSKGPASLFNELPKFLHLGDALDGQSDDLRLGFYPKTFLARSSARSSTKKDLRFKFGFALQILTAQRRAVFI
jgi:hypothetical protein